MFPLRSLRAISFAFIAALSLATVFTGVAVYVALVDAIDRAVDKRLESEALELLRGNPGVAALALRIDSETQLRDSGDIGYQLERGGTVLVRNMHPNHPLPIGLSTVGSDAGITGLTRGRALVIARADGARLTMVVESEPIDRHDLQRTVILSAGFGTILILMIAGTLALSFAIRRNIAAVRDAAEAIVEGDLSARVPVAGRNSAFGQQAETFNHMLDRIEELMASLREVSNDIAHDLRTPLARLRGRLASVMAQPEAAAVRPALADAVAESDELLALFAAILRIAEVEGGDARASFASLDLSAVAEDVAASLEVMVTDSGRTLRLGPWPTAPIQGDRRLLVQLLVNLIENAVNHTGSGSAIAVSVECDAEDAVLIVADDGPGIAPEDRALAMRRFGRLDHSRGRPGNGLGLPLVSAIARLHHGALELHDAAPGLRAVVRLPRVK